VLLETGSADACKRLLAACTKLCKDGAAASLPVQRAALDPLVHVLMHAAPVALKQAKKPLNGALQSLARVFPAEVTGAVIALLQAQCAGTPPCTSAPDVVLAVLLNVLEQHTSLAAGVLESLLPTAIRFLLRSAQPQQQSGPQLLTLARVRCRGCLVMALLASTVIADIHMFMRRFPCWFSSRRRPQPS
jgi:hypothetical protein